VSSDKITPEHLARKAIVYVRQSTHDQVRHHRESQRRQYDLAAQARALGWQAVDVIDEDLGRSGTTAVGRTGFARLVAAVCLREVGAVFSLEASRLARNNRDWYQLIDLCTLVGTLIIDFDGVYDPRLLNDRLVLGLKGTMSEFEIGLLRQRGHEALRQMAQRGALITTLPIGYVRSADGRCEKDPDRRVQHALERVFERFTQCGSVRQVFLWFREERLTFPMVVYGPEGRTVEWRLPVYHTILKTLTNPTYAGAYVFGRTETLTRMVGDRAVATAGHRREREKWEVLIQDHHAGYISWATYEQNQQQIRENSNMQGRMSRGAVRKGQSLLAGLLRCARCGRRLYVSYVGEAGATVRYSCRGAALHHAADRCITFGGMAVDRAVEREVLRVVEPAATEAALAALAAVEGQHAARRAALTLARQQAQYEAARARRQYDAVEPENRLVAAELEQRWNRALEEVARMDVQLREVAAPTDGITDEERADLLALADDLGTLWSDPATDMATKKRLVRTVLEEIIVDVDHEHGKVDVVLHWVGGCHTRLQVTKPRTGEHRFRTDRDVIDLVRELAQIVSDQEIAGILNRLRLRTGKGNTWTETRVRSMRQAHEISGYAARGRPERTWVTADEAAAELAISAHSVRRLIRDGVLPARQIITYAPWMIERSALAAPEVQRAAVALKERQYRPLRVHPDQEMLDLQAL
jgi:DNA invertase Pin-like site-specific DNA recombinase